MQQDSELDFQPSTFFRNFSNCQRKMDWRKLPLFEEELGLGIRGDFIVFTILFLEEDEAGGWASNSPLHEHRAKTLLQGLVYSIYELLRDWTGKVNTLPSVQRSGSLSRVEDFAQIMSYLEGIVRFYERSRLEEHDNQGFRDDTGVLWVLEGEAKCGEYNFFCLRDIIDKLIDAFDSTNGR